MIRIHNASAAEKEMITKIYQYVLDNFGINEAIDVDLTFVGRAVIRQLNADYRNLDKVTDVLTFPNVDVSLPFSIADYPFEIENGALQLGEIMICRARLKEQAQEYNHSETRELCFLTVHGLLHLLGFDHVTAEGEKEMFGLQDLILSKAGITR